MTTTERANREGMTFVEWAMAARLDPEAYRRDRKVRKAWREGEDPLDHRAAAKPAPEAPKAWMEYVAPERSPVPDSVSVGQFVRARHGDLHLWRVIQTFDPSSPYVYCVRVSRGKFCKPGDTKRLLEKERHMVEPNPEGFARYVAGYLGFDPADLLATAK